MAVYVIGLPQSGGAWVWRDEYYTDFKECHDEVLRLRKPRVEGGKEGTEQVFELHLHKETK